MILVTVTFSIPDSVGGEVQQKAIEWAKKITKYLQRKWPEKEFTLLTNYDGEQSDIHWSSKHESMSANEKFAELYSQDEGVKSLLEEAGEISRELGGALLFVNSRHHFYRIVDLD